MPIYISNYLLQLLLLVVLRWNSTWYILCKEQKRTCTLAIGAVRNGLRRKFCYLIKPMRLMVESYARQLFVPFFFIKKRNALVLREILFLFIYFAGAQRLLRTDVYFLCRISGKQRYVVNINNKKQYFGLFSLVFYCMVNYLSSIFNVALWHQAKIACHLSVSLYILLASDLYGN